MKRYAAPYPHKRTNGDLCLCRSMRALPRPTNRSQRRAVVRAMNGLGLDPHELPTDEVVLIAHDLGGVDELVAMIDESEADGLEGWDTAGELGFLKKIVRSVSKVGKKAGRLIEKAHTAPIKEVARFAKRNPDLIGTALQAAPLAFGLPPLPINPIDLLNPDGRAKHAATASQAIQRMATTGNYADPFGQIRAALAQVMSVGPAAAPIMPRPGYGAMRIPASGGFFPPAPRTPRASRGPAPAAGGFQLTPGVAIAGGVGLLAVALLAGGRR